MKKKINKDFTNHWLYPYIGSYCMNFEGMSFGRLFQILNSLSSHSSECPTIHYTDLVPIPLGKDMYCLHCTIYNYISGPDFDNLQVVTTYPMKRSTLLKYGSFVYDNRGFLHFFPRKKWNFKLL